MTDFITTIVQPPGAIVTELRPLSVVTVINTGQGPAGVSDKSYQPETAVAGFRAIIMKANQLVVTADCRDASHFGLVIGISLQAATYPNFTAVKSSGYMSFEGWSWTPNLPVYVSESGLISQTLHPDAVYISIVGWARSPTEIYIDLQPPVAIGA